ncbi:hypothetical protein J1614_004813 [Plenodomus biglobosus]|nr:hypothetical protein J1614_004813 [Plenodomus biglobosus]
MLAKCINLIFLVFSQDFLIIVMYVSLTALKTSLRDIRSSILLGIEALSRSSHNAKTPKSHQIAPTTAATTPNPIRTPIDHPNPPFEAAPVAYPPLVIFMLPVLKHWNMFSFSSYAFIFSAKHPRTMSALSVTQN